VSGLQLTIGKVSGQCLTLSHPARPARGGMGYTLSISSGMEVHDMSGRILIDVTDLLNVAAGYPQVDSGIRRRLADLADELNANLDGYEVRLIHLDTVDYLEFIGRDPTEGEFWAAEQAEREAIAASLFAEGEEAGPDPAQGGDSGHTAGE